MARKRKPFQQKRGAPAPYRQGSVIGFYIPFAVQEAIADVARARGNISHSELVRSILAAHPDIAAQMAIYQHPDRSGSDQEGGAYSSLFVDQPDLWERDQDQGYPDQGEAPDQPDQRPGKGTSDQEREEMTFPTSDQEKGPATRRRKATT